MEKTKQQFDHDMEQIYFKAKKLGYTPNHFLPMLKEKGGIETAKVLVMNEKYSSGFTRLWELSALNLSVEALVLRKKYEGLFLEEIRIKARNKLKAFHFNEFDELGFYKE